MIADIIILNNMTIKLMEFVLQRLILQRLAPTLLPYSAITLAFTTYDKTYRDYSSVVLLQHIGEDVANISRRVAGVILIKKHIIAPNTGTIYIISPQDTTIVPLQGKLY